MRRNFERSPAPGVFLVTALRTTRRACRWAWAALREWRRAPPSLTMGEMPLLAALSLFAAWRCVALLVSLGREMMLPLIAAASLAALVLLAAARRFRRP